MGLLALAYLAYRIGKGTVVDPLEQQVKHLTAAITTQTLFGVVIPRKIEQARRVRRGMMVVGVVAGVALGVAYHWLPPQELPFRVEWAGLAVAGWMGLALLIGVYELVQGFRVKRGSFNHMQLQQKLASLVGGMGAKTEALLKFNMCRQLYATRARQPAGVCSKTNCQQERQLLREKSDNVGRFVDNTINFEWCSQCRKRLPFDELLSFRAQQYQPNPDCPPEAEVTERNKYLLRELERMVEWGREAGPCNCSRRYLPESTQRVLEFKRKEKEL